MASMQQRMKELNCVDVTPPDSPVTDDYMKSKRFLAKPESLDSLAYSDSELSWRNEYTDANSNNTKVIILINYFYLGINIYIICIFIYLCILATMLSLRCLSVFSHCWISWPLTEVTTFHLPTAVKIAAHTKTNVKSK